MEGVKILSVYHVAEDPEDCEKVTLNPSGIKYVSSRDAKVNGIDLKNVQIFFYDSEPLIVSISAWDLSTLESVVGAYHEDGY